MIETELAYAAGVVDGEGYVGIKKSKAYRCQGRVTSGYHARIQVRMVDGAALKLLARLFGGHLYFEPAGERPRRPLFCWSLSDAGAAAALVSLRPHLRIKRRVAAAVLRLRTLQATGTKHRTKVTGYRNFPNSHGTPRRVANLAFSDAYVARCERLWLRCRELNHAPGWMPKA